MTRTWIAGKHDAYFHTDTERNYVLAQVWACGGWYRAELNRYEFAKKLLRMRQEGIPIRKSEVQEDTT